MSTRLTIFLSIVSFVSTCDRPTEPSGGPKELLPLAVGNSWHYAQSWARLDSIAPDTTITMDVWKKDTFNAFVGYYINNMVIAPVNFLGGSLMIANRADGLYTAEITFTDPPQLIVARALPYPTLVGDSVSYLQYKVRTQSLGRPVTVPAGSFSCIEYMFLQNNDTLATIWCAPGVGFVKTWAKYGLGQYTHRLVSFSLK